MEHNSAGAVAAAPVKLLQPLQPHHTNNTVILCFCNYFQFRYYCKWKDTVSTVESNTYLNANFGKKQNDRIIEAGLKIGCYY